MRKFLLAASLCLAPLMAQADPIEDVISGQLDAFASRDIVEAWDHASPMIQGQFFDARNFGAMVEMGYDPIWNNQGARFAGRMVTDGRIRQTVVITDANSALHAYEYDMIETPRGWKINGVRPVEMPDAAV